MDGINANTCKQIGSTVFAHFQYHKAQWECVFRVCGRARSERRLGSLRALEASVDGDLFGYGQWQKFVHEIWPTEIYMWCGQHLILGCPSTVEH